MKFTLVERLNHSNFLFHGTSAINDILTSNTLKVGRSYADGSGVCLSRDYQFVKNFPYILVLNKDKLQTKYKLYPKSDAKNMRNKYSRNIKTQSKAEEMVLQDITNLNNYIEWIISDYELDHPRIITKEKFIKEVL